MGRKQHEKEKGANLTLANPLNFMVELARIELATS